MKTHDFSPESEPVEPTSGTSSPLVAPALDVLVQSAKDYASHARAPGTRKAYAKHWAAFAAWCSEQSLCALPAAPQTVALYMGHRLPG